MNDAPLYIYIYYSLGVAQCYCGVSHVYHGVQFVFSVTMATKSSDFKYNYSLIVTSFSFANP